MRARFVVLVLAILVVAGFAAQNWSEFVRPAPLLFGTVLVDAPLGIVMLGMLVLAMLAFIIASASMATRSMVESRHHHKTLEAQRELADKAEASRFTDLRRHLDLQLLDLRQRDSVVVTEFEKAVLRSQGELRAQLEQMNRALASRVGELEHRIDARLDRLGWPAVPSSVPLDAPLASAIPREPTAAEELRETADEADARLKRLEAQRQRERELHGVAERSTEAGWRRWF